MRANIIGYSSLAPPQAKVSNMRLHLCLPVATTNEVLSFASTQAWSLLRRLNRYGAALLRPLGIRVRQNKPNKVNKIPRQPCELGALGNISQDQQHQVYVCAVYAVLSHSWFATGLHCPQIPPTVWWRPNGVIGKLHPESSAQNTLWDGTMITCATIRCIERYWVSSFKRWSLDT